jgi:hypothetical protein
MAPPYSLTTPLQSQIVDLVHSKWKADNAISSI